MRFYNVGGAAEQKGVVGEYERRNKRGLFRLKGLGDSRDWIATAGRRY